jgi:hypothetical protein
MKNAALMEALRYCPTLDRFSRDVIGAHIGNAVTRLTSDLTTKHIARHVTLVAVALEDNAFGDLVFAQERQLLHAIIDRGMDRWVIHAKVGSVGVKVARTLLGNFPPQGPF